MHSSTTCMYMYWQLQVLASTAGALQEALALCSFDVGMHKLMTIRGDSATVSSLCGLQFDRLDLCEVLG